MNAKFLVFILPAFLTFTWGCAHTADVAKSDIPEEEVSEPPGAMTKMERGIASVGDEHLAAAEGQDDEAGATARTSEMSSQKPPRTYNTLSYVKKMIGLTGTYGSNADNFGRVLLSHNWEKIDQSEAGKKENDVCTFSGGRRSVGTIWIMQADKKWHDGMGEYTTLGQRGYHLNGCFREKAKN